MPLWFTRGALRITPHAPEQEEGSWRLLPRWEEDHPEEKTPSRPVPTHEGSFAQDSPGRSSMEIVGVDSRTRG